MQSRRVGRAGDDSFVLFEGLLSERQLANARTYVRSDEVQAALDEGILFDEKDEDVGSDVENGPPQGSKKRKRNQSQRKSRIAWLERTRYGDGDDDQPNTSPLVPEWLHARLRLAAKETHAKLGETLCPIGFDSAGRWTPRYEPIQYAEYGPGSHYASCSRWWHTDSEAHSDDPEDVRGVTVVVLLSDTNAFSGGKFQVRSKSDPKSREVALKAGDAIGFPAQRLEHRVSKVKEGLRQSLVFWATRLGGR